MLNKIKIVLAEDHLIVRNGFKSLLQQEEDIQVVGEAENGDQVLQLFQEG
ncbi:MAG: LuxR family transcriptional regulator, partial [Daejeonella sp.]|nr:LuxR family transcriptional regulator [Daejeonella sp.]